MVKQKGVDRIDEKILNGLLQDAKMPLRELAQKAGTSFVTVMNRIRKLEKGGVIRGYLPRINYEALGQDVHVIIDIRIAKGKLLELERKIARAKEVMAVYDTTGEYDAVIIARFPSTRAMDSFLKRIQTYDFVERTNTKLVLNTVKEGREVL